MTTPVCLFGEDVDMLAGYAGNGVPTVSTAGAAFRGNFARCALMVTHYSPATDPASAYWPTQLWKTALATFWTHNQVHVTGVTTTANMQMLAMLDNAGVSRLLVRGTGLNGQVKLSKRNAAGTITDLPGAISAVNAVQGNLLFQLDVHVVYGTVGTFAVYQNSVLIASYSGDITTDGGGHSFQQLRISGLGDGNAVYWSEGIVSPADTRASNLQLLNSSVAGAADAWTGAIANVNKIFSTDATFVWSATNGQLQEYKPAAVADGNWIVEAVGMSARVVVGATGPQHMDFITRIGATEYASEDYTPNTTFNNYGNYIQSLNPATGAAFTTADLADTNFQYGLKAVA